MKFQPLDDRCVVLPDEAEKASPGGIIIPDVAKEKPQRGRVTAVGPGRMLESGTRAEMAIQIGDDVLFQKYAGSQVEMGESDVHVLRESDILAIIRDE